jgi:hypothetical protein
VQTYQITISQGRDKVDEIRRVLFAFSEILDVFVTGRPDLLVVVCAGRPRLRDWRRALRAFGYDIPARRDASSTATTRGRRMHIHGQASQIAQARRAHAA